MNLFDTELEEEVDVFVVIDQGDRVYADVDSCFYYGDAWSWRTHWSENVIYWQKICNHMRKRITSSFCFAYIMSIYRAN